MAFGEETRTRPRDDRSRPHIGFPAEPCPGHRLRDGEAGGRLAALGGASALVDHRTIRVTVGQGAEAPLDLEPRMVSISVRWTLPEEGAEVFVVIDPDDKVKNEITTFNNKASKKLERDPEFKKEFLGEA